MDDVVILVVEDNPAICREMEQRFNCDCATDGWDAIEKLETYQYAAILIDADAILKVGDFLKPVDFYRAQHADIYEAMLALHGQREPIDLDITQGDFVAVMGPSGSTDVTRSWPGNFTARPAIVHLRRSAGS